MDLQHSSPLKHRQTLFLKLNWHDLPQTTSSDEEEVVLRVWKDFNSREEELSNTQSATPHGWVEGEPSNTAIARIWVGDQDPLMALRRP